MPAAVTIPNDPSLAHADDEATPVADLAACFDALHEWLTLATGQADA